MLLDFLSSAGKACGRDDNDGTATAARWSSGSKRAVRGREERCGWRGRYFWARPRRRRWQSYPLQAPCSDPQTRWCGWNGAQRSVVFERWRREEEGVAGWVGPAWLAQRPAGPQPSRGGSSPFYFLVCFSFLFIFLLFYFILPLISLVL